MQHMVLGCALLSLTLPLAAQTPRSQTQHDADQMVEGGGKFPAGWQARLDKPDAKVEAVRFVTMSGGFHATTGPATILFNPSHTAKGDYRASATFTQTRPSEHPEAYGLIIGGADLSAPAQRYTYFIIRQDGKYMIKRRTGTETKPIVDWTESPAIKRADAEGKMSNGLAVIAAKDSVRFLVNGTEVASQPRAAVDADGVVGLRVNHNLDVLIGDFGLRSGTSH